MIEASNLLHETTKTKLERYEKLCERASWEDPEAPDETPSQGGGEISVKIECGSDDDVQIIERPSDASSSSSSSSGSSSSSSSSSKPKGLFAAVPGKVTRKHTAFNKPFGNVDNFPREDKIDIFALKACFDNTKKYLYHHKLLTCEYCRRALYEHYEQDKPILCCHKCCRVVWCSVGCAAAHETHKLCCVLHPGWEWRKQQPKETFAAEEPPTKRLKLSDYTPMPTGKSEASGKANRSGKGSRGGKGKGGRGGKGGKGGKGRSQGHQWWWA